MRRRRGNVVTPDLDVVGDRASDRSNGSLGKETVMADITAWIEARLLGGATSAADH